MTELLKKDYKACSYTLASCVLGLIFMRLFVYFVPFPYQTYGHSLISSTVFAVGAQLIFFFAIPFCIYKFYGGKSTKQVFEFSSCGKFKPRFLLALPLGLCAFILTVGVSSAWSALLDWTGYNVTSASTPKPDEFVFGYFVVDMLLTAVLPAFCEEFCLRGGVLTTAQNSFKKWGCVLFCGIAFGLFHQNIRQVFYTSLFGAFAAYLTIEFKSLYPAILAHFVNNFCSVFFDYASHYKWGFLGELYNALHGMNAWGVLLVFLGTGALAVLLVVVMLYIRDKKIIDAKKEVLKDSAFDATNKRVVLMGEFDPERVSELEMEKEVYGADYERALYKPKARDIMIIVALGVVTLCTTVFTYVWGFFY